MLKNLFKKETVTYETTTADALFLAICAIIGAVVIVQKLVMLGGYISNRVVNLMSHSTHEVEDSLFADEKIPNSGETIQWETPLADLYDSKFSK